MTQWLPKILATQQAGIVTYLLKISSMNLRPAAQSESQILNKALKVKSKLYWAKLFLLYTELGALIAFHLS